MAAKLTAEYKPPIGWFHLVPTVCTAMLAIVILNVFLDFGRKPEASAVQADSKPLKLRATLSAQQVEVSWDHDSAAVEEADKATLQISDGGVTETVPFDARQLQDGSLIYRPRTNDVSVRMEVTERDGRLVSESVRAVVTP